MRTELHRHLDASVRASTLAELAGFASEDEVRRNFWLTQQMGSLKEVLDRFVVFQKMLKTPEILERVALEAVEDAAREGIEWLELRYSPSFTSEFSGISWDAALAAFKRGLAEGGRRTGLKTGLICIVSRDYGEKSAHETIDFAVAHKDSFIGVDLAGNESEFPCRMFTSAFQKAVRASLPVTVHAGESAGPENVWDAIDLLGARRIGHGITSIADAELIRRLRRDGILLETCPTSNYITRSIPDWKDHPLPRLLEAGVPVSVSTDDPGIFGNTLDDEYSRCKDFLGMSAADLVKIDEHARSHSFLK